jgi:hypothetical protein
MKFLKRSVNRAKRKEKVEDDKTISSRSGGEGLTGFQPTDVESTEIKEGSELIILNLDETTSLNHLYRTENSTLTECTSNRTHNPTVTFDRKDTNAITHGQQHANKIEDELHMKEYKKIPILESIHLPRGGVSVDTEAVGRVQVSQAIELIPVSG